MPAYRITRESNFGGEQTIGVHSSLERANTKLEFHRILKEKEGVPITDFCHGGKKGFYLANEKGKIVGVYSVKEGW